MRTLGLVYFGAEQRGDERAKKGTTIGEPGNRESSNRPNDAAAVEMGKVVINLTGARGRGGVKMKQK